MKFLKPYIESWINKWEEYQKYWSLIIIPSVIFEKDSQFTDIDGIVEYSLLFEWLFFGFMVTFPIKIKD